MERLLIDLAAGVSGRCATSTAMPRHDAPDSSSSPVARSLWGPPLLRRRRPGTERALRVAVGTVRPGQRALARELLRSLFPVDVARERRHECDEVVELAFLKPEWLDVLIEPGVSEPRSLVVVVEDVPERLVRPVVEVRSGDQDVPQARRLERCDFGLLLGDEKAAQSAHVGPDRGPVYVGRVAAAPSTRDSSWGGPPDPRGTSLDRPRTASGCTARSTPSASCAGRGDPVPRWRSAGRR